MRQLPVLLLMVVAVGGQVLVGKGSSLLCPLLDGWRKGYTVVQDIDLEYTCSGSGSGKAALKAMEVDFAGTDSVFTEADYTAHPQLQLIPVVAAPIAIVFNIPGVVSINLDRTTLSLIFSGIVTRWDDRKIQKSNPLLDLPDKEILVAVRNDSSGTTEIMTSGLSAFGQWTGGAPSSTWPDSHTFPDRVAKSSGMLAFVEETPYSIGYNGVSGALSTQLSFASVINEAGKATIPGWADGAAAASGLQLNATTLTGNLVNGAGYPLSGVSYLAFRADNPTSLCAVIDFMYWVTTESVAKSIVSSNSLVPISVESNNMVLTRLAEPGLQCGKRLLNQIHATAATKDLQTFLKTLAYPYHESSPSQYVTVKEVEPTTHVKVRSSEVPSSSGFTPMPMSVGLLAMGCNFGLAIPSIELELQTIMKIFERKIDNWNNEEIRSRNRYVPSHDLPIIIVADEKGTWIAKIFEIFGWDAAAAASFTPNVTVSSEATLATYLKNTPGAISVLPHSYATQWELPVVHPVLEGLPAPPSLEELGKAINLSAFTSDLTIQRTSPQLKKTYPFYYVIYVDLQTDIRPEHGCTEVPGSVQFMSWLVRYPIPDAASSVIADRMAELQLYSLVEILQDPLHSRMKTITCNGTVIYQDSRDMLITYLSVAGGVLGLVVGVCLTAMVWKWRGEKEKYKSLYGANVLATETAEAVACLDFEVLEKLDALENPDRIQAAMLTIMSIMKEFVKYIPQHVVKSVRYGTGKNVYEVADDGDTTVFTESTNESGEDTLESSVSKSFSHGNKSSNGKVFKQLSGKAIRVVGVCIVRPLITPPNQHRSIEEVHGEFLQWVISISELDTKATLHRVQEECVVLAWGSLGGDMGRYRVTKTSCKLTEKAHCGVKIGLSLCGSLGSENIKTFHILGGLLEEADVLSRLAQLTGAGCVTSHSLEDHWGSAFEFSKFFKVSSLLGGGRWIDTALLSFNDIENSINAREWMYELQERQDSQELAGWKLALSQMFELRDTGKALITINEHITTADTPDRFELWLQGCIGTLSRHLMPGDIPPPIEPSQCGSIFAASGVKLSSCPIEYVRPCPIATPSSATCIDGKSPGGRERTAVLTPPCALTGLGEQLTVKPLPRHME